MQLSEEAQAIRRAYKKNWNARNRDKVREAQRRYWERIAAASGEETEKQDEPGREIMAE